MRSVLFIAYYFPPMGFSGVQRPLKFVKYLPEFGWRPTVLTIHPHAYFAFDDSLLDDMRGRDFDIWRTQPGRIFTALKTRRTLALEREGLRKFLNRVSQFFFVPDNKGGWRRRAMNFLAGQDMSQFDAVFATAPPFTDHLLALDIKQKYGLPVVADFRDAWVDYPYYRYWTAWHRRRNIQLERRVVLGVDRLITTNNFVRNGFIKRHSEADSSLGERIDVITQGFDPDDFKLELLNGPEFPDDGTVHFVHSGNFYEDRKPTDLFKAIEYIKLHFPAVYPRLLFTMVGYMQSEFRRMAEQMGIDDRMRYFGYVDHPIAIHCLQKTDVVWFNIGADDPGFETVAPGKVFEYIGSTKPIIAVVPKNEIGSILSKQHQARIVEPGDVRGFALAICDCVKRKDIQALPIADPEDVNLFDRRQLTGRLAEILAAVAK